MHGLAAFILCFWTKGLWLTRRTERRMKAKAKRASVFLKSWLFIGYMDLKPLSSLETCLSCVRKHRWQTKIICVCRGYLTDLEWPNTQFRLISELHYHGTIITKQSTGSVMLPGRQWVNCYARTFLFSFSALWFTLSQISTSESSRHAACVLRRILLVVWPQMTFDTEEKVRVCWVRREIHVVILSTSCSKIAHI